MDSYSTVFQSIGLEATTISNTLKSKKKAGRHSSDSFSHSVADLMESIKEAGVVEGCDRVLGNLM